MKLPDFPPRFLPLLAASLATAMLGSLATAMLGSLVAVVNRSNSAIANTTPPIPAYQSRKLCDLSDERIDESSGLGASRRYPGHLWTHNDSGDEARLFLINLEGKTVSEVKLAGASAWDWEDMAVAGSGEDAWVYAGDIGDNFGARSNIAIYRFREPTIDLKNPPATLTVPWERMLLTYPDGAHNAETLMATADGHLIIVTKSEQGSLIFKTPQSFAPKTTQKLVRVGAYDFSQKGQYPALATGGDLNPDGKRLVVCTLRRAYEWTLPADKPWTSVWQAEPRTFELPKSKQNEAICYSADGRSLFTTSEQRPTPLYELTGRAGPTYSF